MSKFHLRIANAQDSDSVCTKIEAPCAFHEDQAKLDPVFFFFFLSDPKTQLRVILAEDRGQIIGLMAYYPVFRLHDATSGLHLHQLFIDEGHRGQGCAREFMNYLTKVAIENDARYITVSADLQNEPAHQVYLNMGFKRLALGGAFFEFCPVPND